MRAQAWTFCPFDWAGWKRHFASTWSRAARSSRSWPLLDSITTSSGLPVSSTSTRRVTVPCMWPRMAWAGYFGAGAATYAKVASTGPACTAGGAMVSTTGAGGTMGAEPSTVATGGLTIGGASMCRVTWAGGALVGSRSSSIGGGGLTGGGGSTNWSTNGWASAGASVKCATMGRMTAMSAAALSAMAALMAAMRTVSG